MATSSVGGAGKESEGVDFKYPSWDGDWAKWQDYQLRVELKADGMKQEDLPLLGPRLASNLTGRAFEAIVEINRTELKKENGHKYLLSFLEKTHGKEKIDLLGEALQEFFVKKDVYRRDFEELSDYEPRFKAMIRRLDKALKESGAEGKMPSEVYGWYLVNNYMRMEPSDVANIRGRSESYKHTDILAALHRMWSGGGLAAKDSETKKKKKESNGHAMVVEDEDMVEEEVFLANEDDELAVWYDESLSAFIDDPEDDEVLANFRDARRALGQARTSRGFYPVKDPNLNRGSGFATSKGRGKGRGFNRDNQFADKICMRCGKKGHIARTCPQKGSGSDRPPAASSIGFVGVVMEQVQWDDQPRLIGSVDAPPFHRGMAILDSGASDNVIGVNTLQELADVFAELGYDVSQTIEVDRKMHKSFVYGSDHTSTALGLAHFEVGISGYRIPLSVHVVEGNTPLLLSAKFMYDMKMDVNFREGVAVVHALSDESMQLVRGPGGHLMLPITAFQMNETSPDCATPLTAEKSEPASCDQDVLKEHGAIQKGDSEL